MTKITWMNMINVKNLLIIIGIGILLDGCSTQPTVSQQTLGDTKLTAEIESSMTKAIQVVEYGARCSYASLDDNGVCAVAQMAPVGSACTCPSRFGLINGSIAR